MTQAMVNDFVLAALEAHPVLGKALAEEVIAVRAGTRSINIRVLTKGAALQQLARELRNLRARTNLTQADLAQAIGASQSSVIRLLNGEVLPNWATVFVAVSTLQGNPENYRRLWEDAREQESRHDEE